MNMILYSGSGVSIKTSLLTMQYNNIRSHHYIMYHIARALNCANILDGFIGGENTVIEGSDIYYTQKEFPEYTLRNTTLKDYKNSIAVLFHSQVSKENYRKLIQAVSNSPYFIYYNSDPEFKEGYLDNPMFLDYIVKNPEDNLSKLFRSRCKLILTGFPFMVEQIQKHFDIPVVYIPQIINRNIPRLKSEKLYDAWMINTTPAHKKLADHLTNLGYNLLILTQNHEWCSGDCIELKAQGMHLDVLLSAVSMCKYYLGLYPFLELEDYRMLNPYSVHNHTFKMFECYYANTYPIAPCYSLQLLEESLGTDLYKNQKRFNKWLENNYSLENFKSELKLIKEIWYGK